MAWGTLIHGLLEHAMRHNSSTRDDLHRLAMWLTVDEPQLRSVLDQALATVERVAVAPFWAEAHNHVHHVETPFLVSEARQLTNGVIDLVFNSTSGWRILDYKTDLTLDSAVYDAQLNSYRSALGKVGCEVAGASVLSVRSQS